MLENQEVIPECIIENGSYSVGMIALVICMVIVVNLIAGQLPRVLRA